MPPSLTDQIKTYGLPLPFMGGSIFYFILTFLSNPLLPLTNFTAFKDKAFARLLLKVGPVFSANTPPLLPVLLSQSKGVILDIGPGTGDQIHRFAHPENITAIYGVEPAVGLHEALRQAAEKAGLGDKYHIVGCPADPESLIPALVKEGLIKPDHKTPEDLQVFDEITCIRVLCSVPDQPASIEGLYSLLKPGGRFVLCEHVKNSENAGGLFAQRVYTLLGWRYLMGCELNRETLNNFQRVAQEKEGGWAKVEIKRFDKKSPLVHIVGTLTKNKRDATKNGPLRARL